MAHYVKDNLLTANFNALNIYRNPCIGKMLPKPPKQKLINVNLYKQKSVKIYEWMDMNKVRGQIAFEFLIIYSLAFVMFMVLFGVVSSQQSTITNDQDYLFLQQISQNVAQELSIAQSSGNGFHASFPISSTIYNLPYSLWISNSGAVIARMDINGYIINAISFSGAKALNINGQVIQSQWKTYEHT